MASKDSEGREQSTAERLVDVAGEIFALKGRSATVREICSAAECSVAAINYYFGDKNQLYLQCVRTACEHKQKLFPLPTHLEQQDPEQVMRSFLRAITNRMVAKSNVSWHNTLMLREVMAPSEGVNDLLQGPFHQDFSVLQVAVKKLLKANSNGDELAESITTQILARCMFLRTGKNLRRMFQLDTPENEEPDRYADSIADSILLQIQTLNAGQRSAILPPSATPTDSNPALKGGS